MIDGFEAGGAMSREHDRIDSLFERVTELRERIVKLEVYQKISMSMFAAITALLFKIAFGL